MAFMASKSNQIVNDQKFNEKFQKRKPLQVKYFLPRTPQSYTMEKEQDFFTCAYLQKSNDWRPQYINASNKTKTYGVYFNIEKYHSKQLLQHIHDKNIGFVKSFLRENNLLRRFSDINQRIIRLPKNANEKILVRGITKKEMNKIHDYLRRRLQFCRIKNSLNISSKCSVGSGSTVSQFEVLDDSDCDDIDDDIDDNVHQWLQKHASLNQNNSTNVTNTLPLLTLGAWKKPLYLK
jgi:hypothetical protein